MLFRNEKLTSLVSLFLESYEKKKRDKYFDIFNILSHGFWAKNYSLDLKYPFYRELHPFKTLHSGKTGAP